MRENKEQVKLIKRKRKKEKWWKERQKGKTDESGNKEKKEKTYSLKRISNQ
jgi:hypothetical protein